MRADRKSVESAISSNAKAEQQTDPSQLKYPRSAIVASLVSSAEWAAVARAADFGHREYADFDQSQRKRRLAKSFVEYDRQLRMSELGYIEELSIMSPRTASPKNDVIVSPLTMEFALPFVLMH